MSLEQQKAALEQHLLQFQPTDGFRAEVLEGPDHRTLYVGYHVNGQALNSVEALGYTGKLPPKEAGVFVREQLLAEALARYLNTGGDIIGLRYMLSVFDTVLPRGGLSFHMPAGFYLLDSHVTIEGRYDHIFASDAHPYGIVWSEGHFFDVRSLVDLKNSFELENSLEEPHVEFAPAGPGVQPGPALPAPQADPGGAEAVPGARHHP